jgi:ribosomal protein S18 acetylase RimI-like enzyme
MRPGETMVRQATLADLSRLVPLFDGYRHFYGQPSDPAKAEAFLRERLTNRDSVIFLACDAHGTAVGFIQLYPIFSSVQCRRSWLLNDLFVAPEARRRGVARELMDRARDHGVTSGAAWLMLATQHTNLEAQRLYESLGWRRDEEFLHYELHL